jgi:NitT/TauT family transport system substrate-binding protein
MSRTHRNRIGLALCLGLAIALALFSGARAAEPVKLRFTLDWIPGGVHAPFFIALYKGYYKAEGLDVAIDRGKGSGEVVRQLAAGAYDMGYPDINVLIDFNSKNPDKAIPELMIGYEQAPGAIVTLKANGIETPKQLEGKTLGAAVFDSTYKLFPLFAKQAGFDAAKVKVKTIEPSLREVLLAKHEVDAIAAQMFNAVLELKAKGVPEDKVRYFMYKDYGIDLYANGIAASRAFLKAHPEAVRGFIRATIKGVRDMVHDPAMAIQMTLKFEPLLNAEVERERLKLAMECCLITPNVRKNGFGGVDMARLKRTIGQVAAGYGLTRVPSPEEMFDPSYLPPQKDRMVN